MTTADWIPYALPLRRPWQTSRGAVTVRHGQLLRLRTDDGRLGWGDAAPWPEFGIGRDGAAAFAEETAHLDLAAQAAGLPLHAWLSGQPPVASLAINAHGGTLDSLDAAEAARRVAAGYAIVKMKVGVLPVTTEIRQLEALGRMLPAPLRLRLDANRAWSPPDAASFIDACTGLPVECIEEPLAAPDGHSLAALQERAGFPLAIDESVELLDAGFFAQPPVRRIVVKPSRSGLLAGVDMSLRARHAGIEVVVTSSLESACGLLACAHLAAAVAPEGVHGLGTAEWLARDTGAQPAISSGRLRLPAASGLGFQPGSDYAAGSVET